MALTGSSFRFSNAIVRAPGASVSAGLRAGPGADPDFSRFQLEHQGYVAALRAAGVEVNVLEPLEDFPDSVFVEDAALCLAGCAVLLRPGAPSRAGEPALLQPALQAAGLDVVELTIDQETADQEPAGEDTARVDGGDVLVTDTDVFVGLSARTNQRGIQELAEVLGPLGFSVRVVDTPRSVLHFKSDCGLLDPNTIFATERLAASGCFDGYQVVSAPAGEEAAANLVRINDVVFVAEGHPQTESLLAGLGYSVCPLPVHEAAKIDGGLSCMSLRFSLGVASPDS